jgi:hypothetical protein
MTGLLSNRQARPFGEPEQRYAIQTWRYLRLGMIGLVIGLGVSVVYEHFKVRSDCWQTSISAYYYTPVRAVFVGALIGIGVALISLRGNTPIEDVLLNLAGMFAPVVALVPTPDPGTCTSVIASTQGRHANIANNITALIVLGVVALLVAGILIARNDATLLALIGYGVAWAIWLAAALVFWLARHFFERNAHYTAAVLLFLSIVAVACINAVGYKRATNTHVIRNPYAAIAAAMLVSLAVMIVIGALGWRYWVIVVETLIISLFALFWIIQTVELWKGGLREEPAAGP